MRRQILGQLTVRWQYPWGYTGPRLAEVLPKFGTTVPLLRTIQKEIMPVS